MYCELHIKKKTSTWCRYILNEITLQHDVWCKLHLSIINNSSEIWKKKMINGNFLLN